MDKDFSVEQKEWASKMIPARGINVIFNKESFLYWKFSFTLSDFSYLIFPLDTVIIL